jgi:hypothetical protein
MGGLAEESMHYGASSWVDKQRKAKHSKPQLNSPEAFRAAKLATPSPAAPQGVQRV